MPESDSTLDYATPSRKPRPAAVTRASVARFFGGLAACAAVASLLSLLNSMTGISLLGQVGLGGFHDAVLWLLGPGFLGVVVYGQAKWRWTGFTLGVVAGITLSLLAAAIFYLLSMRGMGAFY